MPSPQTSRSPLSVALAGISASAFTGGTSERIDADALRAALDWLGGFGVSAVQFDATAPGLRPRDLDRSARRDLASLLRRHELTVSGFDLWIPPAHFADPAHAERALAAARDAATLAAELVTLGVGDRSAVVCVVLPQDDSALRAASERELDIAAAGVGARIANFATMKVPPRPSTHQSLGVGIDPASVLSAGADPGGLSVSMGAALVAARLSDADHAGRVNVGDGGLDVHAYAAGLEAIGFRERVVVDVRGVRSAERGIRAAIHAWPRTHTAVEPRL